MCILDVRSALLRCLEAEPWGLVKPPSGYGRLQVPQEGAQEIHDEGESKICFFCAPVGHAKPGPALSIRLLTSLFFPFSPNGAETQAPAGRCASPKPPRAGRPRPSPHPASRAVSAGNHPPGGDLTATPTLRAPQTRHLSPSVPRGSHPLLPATGDKPRPRKSPRDAGGSLGVPSRVPPQPPRALQCRAGAARGRRRPRRGRAALRGASPAAGAAICAQPRPQLCALLRGAGGPGGGVRGAPGVGGQDRGPCTGRALRRV